MRIPLVSGIYNNPSPGERACSLQRFLHVHAKMQILVRARGTIYSLRARARYCTGHVPVLGSGSGRLVSYPDPPLEGMGLGTRLWATGNSGMRGESARQ